MRNFLLTLLALCFCVSAQAQNTLKHEFNENKTVYLDFIPVEEMEGTVLLTMELDGRECKKWYGSIVHISENEISFEGGTKWDLSPLNKEEIRIRFPGKDGKSFSVVYRKTERDPKKYCFTKKDRDI